MLHAELHRKCGDLRLKEDGLTSFVFDILRYREFRDILEAFLGDAQNIHNRLKPDLRILHQNPKFCFWERIVSDSEIDLLLKTSHRQLGIEVKYRSQQESGKGQLGRYSEKLNGQPLIYITTDSVMPPISKESLKTKNIFWLSWQSLYKVLLEHREYSEGLKAELIKDLMSYLSNRGICYFRGFVLQDLSHIPGMDKVFFNKTIFGPKRLITAYKSVFWRNRK